MIGLFNLALLPTQEPDIIQELSEGDYYEHDLNHDLYSITTTYPTNHVSTPEITPPVTPTLNYIDDVYTAERGQSTEFMNPNVCRIIQTPVMTDVSESTASVNSKSEHVASLKSERADNRDMA